MLSRRQQKIAFFALQSWWIATESRWIAMESHYRDAIVIRRDENVIMTVKIEFKSDRSQFMSIRFEQKLLHWNRGNFLHFIIHLVFFYLKKKFVWENMNFLKKKIFLVDFGNWSYQNDHKIFVIFFMSILFRFETWKKSHFFQKL